MKKNELKTVEITDYTQEGLGVGRADEMTVFVKDTVIGDIVEAGITKVRKNYAFARVEKVIKESPDRISPQCPSARACGGCQIQMMDYRAQLRFKEKKVRNCLTRIGGFDEAGLPMEAIMGMDEPWHYRNKAQFPVGKSKDGRLIAGFYAGRTHNIIEQPDCMIGIEENSRIVSTVLEYMTACGVSAYDEESGEGLVRHIMVRKGFASGQIMVCLIINGKKIPRPEKLTGALLQIPGIVSIVLNHNTRNTNVIFGPESTLLYGEPYLEDRIGDVRYQISARSFYQVNPVQTEKLYRTALEFAGLTGKETVWDLYCGIGTISLFLARKAAKVYGVEIIPEAIEDARRNAGLNGIQNAEFFVGKAEEVLPEKCRNGHLRADVIVVDPPRKGCEEAVLETMIQMEPERIVYVSCDPATLARDLKILCGRGYRLERVRPCDMFPHSVHVETVVRLSKGDIDRDSSERKSIAKTDDIGMISGYNKGNKAPETTSPSQKMPNSRSAHRRKKRQSCRHLSIMALFRGGLCK